MVFDQSIKISQCLKNFPTLHPFVSYAAMQLLLKRKNRIFGDAGCFSGH